MNIVKLDLLDDSIVEKIINLEKKSYQIEADLINFYNIPQLHDTVEKLRRCNEIFIGYFEGNVLAGIISYQLIGSELEICRLAVDPGYFRKGIAGTLIDSIENMDANVERITVTTGKNNTPAVNFYRKCGYIFESTFTVEEILELSEFSKLL